MGKIKKESPSKKKKQSLYWVTTLDHDEDWFIVAKTGILACSFHEDFEGYNSGEATAQKICAIPTRYCKKKPHHAQLDLLKKTGFNFISSGPARVVRKSGKIYREGVISHTLMFGVSDEKGAGVYIIRVSGTQKFKIGIAKNFKKRFKDLQTGSSEELEPHYFYPTTSCQELEKHLHCVFKNNSIGREWFEFDFDEINKVHDVALKFLKLHPVQ